MHLATDANGIRMNAYFVDNPEMVLGDMQMVSGPHGMESACIAYENAELGDLLRDAIQNIHAEITEFEIDDAQAPRAGGPLPQRCFEAIGNAKGNGGLSFRTSRACPQ